jgi:hypothetical protein
MSNSGSYREKIVARSHLLILPETRLFISQIYTVNINVLDCIPGARIVCHVSALVEPIF